MPYIVKKTINGQELNILIDTGTSKNYIRNFNFIKGIKSVAEHFRVKSINGSTLIKEKCEINILNHSTTFFILPCLNSFDGILGYDFLKEIEALIDIKAGILFHKTGKEQMNHFLCKQVNSIEIDNKYVPSDLHSDFENLIRNNAIAFADPDRALPANTQVEAKINLTRQEPIYSRSYPYPISATQFINTEIENLLKDGIIRKSSSPYNSPIHVVSKKGVDRDGRQKLRMVVDFRKINDFTIPDKYPMPDIAVILSNLGKSKFFTTLDLKSGFHQIMLAEKDRCKTAFSINNGKYEFCRLPFGLRNAPSIFQRAIDDILRDEIGKTCFVYMDDVIIFSEDANSHIPHVDKILKKLSNAGMRISTEKSKFFRHEVEFLGFVVSQNGIKTSPDKVHDILNFQIPKTLRALRSFIGLAGYYRRFIRNYADIVKPLTTYLRGENGNVNVKISKNVKISLSQEALNAFDKVKRILASEDVLLQHPDFNKPFELTTDASSNAIGAVLSQNDKPITMISRTLSSTEQNYATNERELLCIVWSLQKLRHFLYGVKNINIFTDHQPLTFATSDKNPNPKIKRWQAFIADFSPKFNYKPGKENVVADALSRQYMNNFSNTDSETVHSEISFSKTIKSITAPVNQFTNQLIISKASVDNKITKILFQQYKRHIINYSNIQQLLLTLQNCVNPRAVNAIHCDLSTLAEIQNEVLDHFPSIKFIHTQKFVIDLTNKDDQLETLNLEHNRAHRSLHENYKQITSEYFFPKIKKILHSIIKNCKICFENKYNRKPSEPIIGASPIPDFPGQILHIDIFSTNKVHFLTCLDKFSKFAVAIPITSRALIDVKTGLLQILNSFKNTKLIVSDNEKSFQSNTIKNILRDFFGIEQFFVPPLHSKSNGQVERFHSTLLEIARCVKAQHDVTDTSDLILLSTHRYNDTIHSVTRKKPIDVLQFFATENLTSIRERIVTAQAKIAVNPDNSYRQFNTGDIVFVRRNRRLGNKVDKVYLEKVVQKDLGTSVIIDGRKIHKNNIR